MSTEMSTLDQIREQIITIDNALTANFPGIEHFMKKIHKNLLDNQILVQSLTDDEIGILVAGYSNVSRTNIAESVVKSKGKSNTALKKLTMDDI